MESVHDRRKVQHPQDKEHRLKYYELCQRFRRTRKNITRKMCLFVDVKAILMFNVLDLLHLTGRQILNYYCKVQCRWVQENSDNRISSLPQ